MGVRQETQAAKACVFLFLSVDGKVFMITNTFIAMAFFIKSSIWSFT